MVSSKIQAAIALIESELRAHGKLELGSEAAYALLTHLTGAAEQAVHLEHVTITMPCTGIAMECTHVRALATQHLTRGTRLSADDTRALASFVIAHEQLDRIAVTKGQVRRHG